MSPILNVSLNSVKTVIKTIFVSKEKLKGCFSTVNNYPTSLHNLVFVVFSCGWLGCKWITTFVLPVYFGETAKS